MLSADNVWLTGTLLNLGREQTLQGRLWEQSGSVWTNAPLPFICEDWVTGRGQEEEGGGAKDREEDKGRERGTEKEETGEDLLGPWLNTYWLNRTRERTMNLKMYSKALMALYSCSLIPGFSALAT